MSDTPAAQPHPKRAWVEQIMGMPISIHVRGPQVGTAPAVAAAVASAFDQLRGVDAVFSMWKPESQVSRLSRGELALAGCDAQVRDVVRLCEQARERTEGYFDANLPDADGARRFDPTGLVKGWAVQRVCVALASDLPDHDVLVNAGGDVAVSCGRTDTPDWRLAVENPLDRSEVLAWVDLRSGGIATSGTAARGAHILTPTTGTPATELASVTVLGASLMWADVYATAAFARGPSCVQWLRGLDDATWMVVGLDGSVQTPS